MIAIGDIHGDKLKNLFPNHIELQFNEINKVINYGRREGEKHFALLGDLSENIRLSQEAECAFIRFFCYWDGKIELDVILGNHDFAENSNHSLLPFMEMQRAGVFKTIRFHEKPYVNKIDGVYHNFCPYPFKEPVKNAVNYGHFEVSGSLRDNGMVIAKAHDVGEKENWIMGHLHTPHTVGRVHYTGTLYQLNFGESMPKSFSILNARLKGGKVKVEIERIRTAPAFRLINLVIDSEKDLKKIEKNPLYKYRLLTNVNFETERDILGEYDNVVKMEGFKSKKELKALVEESFIEITEQKLELPSIVEELEKYLVHEKKATPKQVKRALEITKEIRQGK